MNESERSELERIKQRQARLSQELAHLADDLKRIEFRAGSPRSPEEPPELPKEEDLSKFPPPEIPPEIPPHLVPPIIQAAEPAVTASPPVEEQRFIKCLCKHCGGHLEFATLLVGDSVKCPHCGQMTFLAMETKPPIEPSSFPPPDATVSPVLPASPPPPEGSFEMRLGTYWLVRVGIVMLLTGLVFFGNYAYQNLIINLGPTGKVLLLYLASGILLGAGAWWQRKAVKPALQNYAQVLFAGGLASVYFTTYAAHHIETLRVIENGLLDGALLLAWAGFMVWIADRRKSEVLALFAVGLAYYTSVITRVGSFTLYSNLVLTIAAVFFLVRNRWAGLTFASLFATYAAYGYWRFFDGRHWHWASPSEGLWQGTSFLIGYWLVFTAAVFLSRHEKFQRGNRASFLTLNNGQFFGMFLLTMLQVQEGGFWKFALIYGAALLALAELARRMFSTEPIVKNSYLTQGLLLVTIGFISKFTGLKLALLLGAESVVLLTLGTARNSLILQAGAYLTGALAVGWGIDGLERDDWRKLCYNTALGAMMAFNAFWTHRRAKADPAPIRPIPAFFTLLALISWVVATWYNTTQEQFPLALTLEALALTGSIYVLRVREIALLSQSFVLIAHAAWLMQFAQSELRPPWWNPLLIIAATLGLSHWWQRQKALALDARLRIAWQFILALMIVGVFYYWLQPPVVAGSFWVALTALIGVGLTAYGVLTRAWTLALSAQIFLLVSAWQFAVRMLEQRPQWYHALVPLAALGLLSAGAVIWFRRRPEADASIRQPLLWLAVFYRWTALLMSIWWVHEYVAARERMWVLSMLSLTAFVLAGRWKAAEPLLFSAAYGAYALAGFWIPLDSAPTVYWANLPAILAVLGQQYAARRMPARFPLLNDRLQSVVILLGGLSLWLLLGRWVMTQGPASEYLTASWSGLALVLFGCGILLRERMYRWLGLGILACSVGRVFFVDVWRLEKLYRILSFMALGVVLLVLGFVYNKYQEKIRQWM